MVIENKNNESKREGAGDSGGKSWALICTVSASELCVRNHAVPLLGVIVAQKLYLSLSIPNGVLAKSESDGLVGWFLLSIS